MHTLKACAHKRLGLLAVKKEGFHHWAFPVNLDIEGHISVLQAADAAKPLHLCRHARLEAYAVSLVMDTEQGLAEKTDMACNAPQLAG